MRYALACSFILLAVALTGGVGNAAAASTAASTAAASPNGEASKSATQILADVRKAVAGAKSVRIVGSGVSDGEKLEIDMIYDTRPGGGGVGHISINGLGFEIARIDGKTYFKGDANFLVHVAGSQAAKLMEGRWFAVSNRDTEFASLAELASLKAISSVVLKPDGRLSKGAESSVAGQPAIALKDGGDGTLYVAATGPAYPLALTPGKGRAGKIEFEDWNKPVTLTAPKSPINYDALVHGK